MKLIGQSAAFRSRKSERGVTIFLVAVGLSFVILAVSALAIDLVAMYNARQEARLAAEAAALAGARVLATSGVTTDPTSPRTDNARDLAITIATGVATQNLVGGRNLASSEVFVSTPNFNTPGFSVNPQVTVLVRRTDVPTYFARAWGTSSVSVSGTATAEAYNPSNWATAGSSPPPLAPQCVKPWLVPNIDPNNAPNGFFNPSTGAITSGTVGENLTLTYGCPNPGECGGGLPPTPPGSLTVTGPPPEVLFFPANFTAPAANAWPTSCSPACAYEETIVGCSPQPITCGVNSNALIQLVSTGCVATRSNQTFNGTKCMVHIPPAGTTGQDQLLTSSTPSRIRPGSNNPLVNDGILATTDSVWTSDSLVTIPVFDWTAVAAPVGTTLPVNVIGFIQGFVKDVTNPSGNATKLQVTVVNLSGCGTPSTTASPIVGDGVSSVPVHLISQ